MSLGVLFALSQDEVDALSGCADDAARLELLSEEIEERYFKEDPEGKCDLDKAWDAIHRVLTDGALAFDNGHYPASHAILGGKLIYGQDDYIMSLKSPSDVRAISKALNEVGEGEFRTRYFALDATDYDGVTDQDDHAYSWENFVSAREFYDRAVARNGHVLFTADQ